MSRIVDDYYIELDYADRTERGLSNRYTVVPLQAVINEYQTNIKGSPSEKEIAVITYLWENSPATFMVPVDGFDSKDMLRLWSSNMNMACKEAVKYEPGSKELKNFAENKTKEFSASLGFYGEQYKALTPKLQSLVQSNPKFRTSPYFTVGASKSLTAYGDPFSDTYLNMGVAIDIRRTDALKEALESQHRYMSEEYNNRKKAEEELLKEQAIADKIKADKIASNQENITAFRNSVIDASINGTNIIDIIKDYGWNDTTYIADRYHNTPILYAIEYEQTISSAITNLIYTLKTGLTGLGGLYDTFAKLFDGGGAAEGDATKFAEQPLENQQGKQNFFTKLQNKLERVSTLKTDNITTDMTLLLPYNLLYAIQATNKRYVFPYLEDKSFPSITAQWGTAGDTEKGSIFLNNIITSFLGELSNAANSVNIDINNLKAIFGKEGTLSSRNGNAQFISEMAKVFKYDTNGPEYTVTFTLFNTVIKNGNRDIWKNHYRFLYLFMLRNMPWRISPSAFLPPLLYDVIVPGQRRLPLAYVSAVDVQTKGVIRTLYMDRIIGNYESYSYVYDEKTGERIKDENGKFKTAAYEHKNSGKIKVSVPEAWVVTIKFKSLIGDNANLLASGMVDLPVDVKSDSTAESQLNIIGTESGLYNNMSVNADPSKPVI